jgi:hypothetical protein
VAYQVITITTAIGEATGTATNDLRGVLISAGFATGSRHKLDMTADANGQLDKRGIQIHRVVT